MRMRSFVITIMLGMNDGGYHPGNSETENTYLKGYEHLLTSFHDNAPQARVVVLGPSPFDDITRSFAIPGGYNSVLERHADLDQSLSKEHGDDYVNLNSPVKALIEHAQAIDPEFAQFILPDRVHPEPIGNWAMAEAILKAWNAPSEVSSVSINGWTAQIEQSLNASVEHQEADRATLRWTETENALPLPFDTHNALQ